MAYCSLKFVRLFKLLTLVTLISVSGTSCFAQSSKSAKPAKGDPRKLTVDRIFNTSEFAAKSVSAKWLNNASGYVTLEDSRDTRGGKDIVRHDPRSGKTEIMVSADLLVPDGSTKPLTIEAYQFSANQARVLIYTNSRRVWRRNTRGDYWVLDRTSRELKKLGGKVPESSLMFAKFSPQGDRVGYVHANNIYVQDLSSGKIIPVTKTHKPTEINGTFDWVYEEELGLRDGFRFSPDGKWIAYWQIDTEDVREFLLVNNTASLYPQVTKFAYPKVGETNSKGRIGVCSAQRSGDTRWLNINEDPRNHYLAVMDWVDPSTVVVQQLNRLQNKNRVMKCDFVNGSADIFHTDKSDTWVEPVDDLHWLKDGVTCVFISERDGWNHLYLVNTEEKNAIPLMKGWQNDVVSVEHIDEKNGWIYFIGTHGIPTDRYLQRVSINDGRLEDVTPKNQPGTHSYQISPDGEFAIHTHSTMTDPPKQELITLKDHRVVRPLIDNAELRKTLDTVQRPRQEFLQVKLPTGEMMDGWAMTPADLDKSKKYPLMIYVYGEPAGSTVTNRWGGTRQLWHELMAQKGYVVMSFDNRGTKVPRGAKWRKSIYEKVGMIAPEDQALAVQTVLADRSYLDPDRVGIWGWSGGGSMTLNAMFKFPKLYHTGISVAPVPNQRLYDTIYQERYMGLPDKNVEGYRQGSAINYAHQLEGNLLLIHGTGDDNCHYQGTEMLMNELIRHNKRFSLMAYPNRTHAIREGKNTTRHLRQLMTDYFSRNLPAGPQ